MVRGKLSLHYIGLYKISKRIDEVAYKLELPPDLSSVQSVFHILILRKCLADASQVIPVQLEELQEDLLMVEDAI